MSSFAGQVESLTSVTLLANAARAANVAGSLVDIKDFVGKVRVIQDAGAITAGDDNSTFTVYIQHCDDTNTSNVVNANITLTAASNAASVVTEDLDTRALKRYVRAVGNIAGGNSPSFPLGITLTGYKHTD
jgi:hypothetical protein